jgi:hypothetical protein
MLWRSSLDGEGAAGATGIAPVAQVEAARTIALLARLLEGSFLFTRSGSNDLTDRENSSGLIRRNLPVGDR